MTSGIDICSRHCLRTSIPRLARAHAHGLYSRLLYRTFRLANALLVQRYPYCAYTLVARCASTMCRRYMRRRTKSHSASLASRMEDIRKAVSRRPLAACIGLVCLTLGTDKAEGFLPPV